MPPVSSSSITGWRSVDRASRRTVVRRHPAGRALGYLGAARCVCAIRRRSRKRLAAAHRHKPSPADGGSPKEIKFSNRHAGIRSACSCRRPRRAIAASRLGKPQWWPNLTEIHAANRFSQGPLPHCAEHAKARIHLSLRAALSVALMEPEVFVAEASWARPSRQMPESRFHPR
jgi:hypothetical protein